MWKLWENPQKHCLKKHYVTGRTLSSSKRQFRTSSFPFKFKEKIYDKIRILFYKNLIFLRFLLCFSKIKRPQDFILISRSDFFLRILFFTLFRTFGIAPKHSIKPYINIIHYSPYFVNTSRATLL